MAVSACGGETQMQAPPPPQVAVTAVKKEAVELTTVLAGRTVAVESAEVRPQISGIIKARLFEEGDDVKEGQPLYQIEKAPYEAVVASARAALARAEGLAVAAENRKSRYANLVGSKAVSKQDYDDAVAGAKQVVADVAAARATLDSALIELERTTIAAPIDGRIGRSFVTNGALVSAGQAQELAAINTLDPIYVDISQSSAEILRWKRLQAAGTLATDDENNLDVTLTLEDKSVYEHKGKITLTEVNVDPATGSVTLRAVFPNPDGLLLPGMFVRARVSEGVRADAMLIDQQAISRSPQGDGIVYVVKDDHTTETRIVRTDRA
ncbi:MAG: efflux RND transporter periplasmic adaptor subunit, partial [Parvularculaceae bacterium]|nr:efflux RND transporter periplasmic adaptor subunit [Parvularculaceae bacterium]